MLLLGGNLGLSNARNRQKRRPGVPIAARSSCLCHTDAQGWIRFACSECCWRRIPKEQRGLEICKRSRQEEIGRWRLQKKAQATAIRRSESQEARNCQTGCCHQEKECSDKSSQEEKPSASYVQKNADLQTRCPEAENAPSDKRTIGGYRVCSAYCSKKQFDVRWLQVLALTQVQVSVLHRHTAWIFNSLARTAHLDFKWMQLVNIALLRVLPQRSAEEFINSKPYCVSSL